MKYYKLSLLILVLVVSFALSGVASASPLRGEKNWRVVKSPNVGTAENVLNGVAAISKKDAWAVGVYASGSVYKTLIEHWNGASWQVVPSPNVGTEQSTPGSE